MICAEVLVGWICMQVLVDSNVSAGIEALITGSRTKPEPGTGKNCFFSLFSVVQCEKQAGRFTCCATDNALGGITPSLENGRQ